MRSGRSRWLLFLLGLLLAACTVPLPEESVVDAGGCQGGETMNQVPVMPEDVLLQSVLVNARAETAGYRIYADGRYESKKAAQPWALTDPLKPVQVEAVIDLIAGTRFDRLAARYQPDRPATDQNTLWMQVNDAGQRFDVEIVGSCEVPEIQTLTARIVDISR